MLKVGSLGMLNERSDYSKGLILRVIKIDDRHVEGIVIDHPPNRRGHTFPEIGEKVSYFKHKVSPIDSRKLLKQY